jgi:hypothetical protein
MSFPLQIKDGLGRIYLTKYQSKTIFRKFRGNSNVLKSVYNITGDLKNPRTVEIDFINKEGTEIIANYSSVLGFKFKASGFVGFSSKIELDINFPIDRVKIKDWNNRLKK